MKVEYDDKERTFESLEVGETFTRRGGDLHFMKTVCVSTHDDETLSAVLLNGDRAGELLGVLDDSPVALTRMKMVES